MPSWLNLIHDIPVSRLLLTLYWDIFFQQSLIPTIWPSCKSCLLLQVAVGLSDTLSHRAKRLGARWLIQNRHIHVHMQDQHGYDHIDWCFISIEQCIEKYSAKAGYSWCTVMHVHVTKTHQCRCIWACICVQLWGWLLIFSLTPVKEE